MRTIQVKQLHSDLTPTAGLALVGHLLKTISPAMAALDAALPVRGGVASSDVVRSYLPSSTPTRQSGPTAGRDSRRINDLGFVDWSFGLQRCSGTIRT